MPVVTVAMFEGRTEERKAALAREIAASVAEFTGNSMDSVHVIFQEQTRDSWSRGLTLASRRSPNGNGQAKVREEHATVSLVRFDPGTEEDYLALRRDVINPGMATQPGFVASRMYRHKDEENTYLLVNTWTSAEAAADYKVSAVHDELKRQALSILPVPLESSQADVVHLYDS